MNTPATILQPEPLTKPERIRLRRRLYAAQDGLCYLCNENMLIGPKHRKHEDYATLDHVEPRMRRGGNDLGNILLAHRRCNKIKDHRRARPEWLTYAKVVEKRVKAIARVNGEGRSV